MTEEEERIRDELARRVAGRLSLPCEAVTRMLSKDTRLDEIWEDYMLCRETIDRFRAAQNVGEARVAEYRSHAESLEEELVRRVRELSA